jgi:3-hydroxybutyryl-CoA dehydrogenase
VSEAAAEGAADLDPQPGPFSIRTVAVIGAGRVGREFALACAAAGFDVTLEDVMPANLRRAQELYAELHAEAGGLRVALTVEDAVRAADVVVDFVPDELESKLEIFCLVDRMAPPKTVLLTPSDALSITDLASCTYRGERCFAVRGGLAPATDHGPLRLLHPKLADPVGLRAVGEFLRTLGREPRTEEDADAPMLVRNVAGSQSARGTARGTARG